MGLLNEIVSDNDHLLASASFTSMCATLVIEQHFAIAYRPQGNWRAECAVKAVVNMLRVALAESEISRVTLLPWTTFFHNSLPGILAPLSPHFVVFGREPSFVGDIPSLTIPRVSVSSEEWMAFVTDIREGAAKKLTAKHTAVHERLTLKHPTLDFAVGDRVWLKDTRDRLVRDKLRSTWSGPSEILAILGETGRYTVISPEGPIEIHVEHSKPYLPKPSGEAIPFFSFRTKNPLPGEKDFVVDKILGHRVHNGIQQWKVRWKVFTSALDTWKPANSFVDQVNVDWKKWNSANNMKLYSSEL